jgi:hypothetical protein
MNLELAKKVADSVLYEGYLLYPYRASAVKNRQRFNFGVLLPPAYAQAQTGNDTWKMTTECLVEGEDPRFDVRVRYLQIIVREAGRLLDPKMPSGEETVLPASAYEIVPDLIVDGQIYQTWQEATEREIELLDAPASELTGDRIRYSNIDPGESREILPDAAGRPAGVLVRRWKEIVCSLAPRATRLEAGLWKLTVEVKNRTGCDSGTTRDEALPHSLVAAHTILTVRGGQFVSLLDPPPHLARHAAACRNEGTWPVLLGSAGERDGILSSPIILYDYPQIAPESGGSFFDGTEIDEMLALRVMTLTDEEKREMRNVDRRAREILERTESMPEEHLRKLHGTIRGMKPATPP